MPKVSTYILGIDRQITASSTIFTDLLDRMVTTRVECLNLFQKNKKSYGKNFQV